MRYAIILSLIAFAASAQVDTVKDTVTLDGWQLEQLRQYDAAAKEIELAMLRNMASKQKLEEAAKEIETAAQVNESNKQTFFKTMIGRDITPQDSVTYDKGKIVIYQRKPKTP